MKAHSILDTIGNTPHIRVNRLFGASHQVWVKSERSNPGGSIKDRIGLSMIEDAEKSGKLKPGGTIIEPTSGNTGIGLAMVAAVKGYTLVLVMPDSMSVERRRLMLAYGATFVLTHRQIVREVWGPAYSDQTHYARVYMQHLRQKLERDPSRPAHLVTETGVGYRFVPH